MISVLIIAHQPLATALLGCCRHVYRGLPMQAAALDIIPDEDPEQALREARALASRINDGSGQVVLTDLYGATPSRIAVQMAVPGRVSVFYGVNLPMLLKVFNYRARLPLVELESLVLRDAADGIGLVDIEFPGRRLDGTGGRHGADGCDRAGNPEAVDEPDATGGRDGAGNPEAADKPGATGGPDGRPRPGGPCGSGIRAASSAADRSGHSRSSCAKLSNPPHS